MALLDARYRSTGKFKYHQCMLRVPKEETTVDAAEYWKQ